MRHEKRTSRSRSTRSAPWATRPAPPATKSKTTTRSKASTVSSCSTPSATVSSSRRLRNSVEQADEVFKLPEIAALIDTVAVGAVLAHDRVAGVPVGARLGVEPIHVARPLVHLVDDPRLGGVVVVPGVAQQQHRRLG